VWDRKADPSFKPVASKQPANLKTGPSKPAPHHIRHPPSTWKWANVAAKVVKPKLIRGQYQSQGPVPAHIWNDEAGRKVLPPLEPQYVRANIRHDDVGRAAPPPPRAPLVSAHDVTQYGFAEPPAPKADRRVVANAHIDWGHKPRSTREHRRHAPRVVANAHITPDRAAREHVPRQPRQLVTANAHITREHKRKRGDDHRRARRQRQFVSAIGHITPDTAAHEWSNQKRKRERHAIREPKLVSADLFRRPSEMTASEIIERKPKARPELVSADVHRSADEWTAPQQLPPKRKPAPRVVVSADVQRSPSEWVLPEQRPARRVRKPEPEPLVSADIAFPRL